MKNIRNYM